ncbi:MAG: VOC family protein [Verrucomicrobiales bacterium]|nr:VOC family protein [Verrucomicrobiales bacterium]
MALKSFFPVVVTETLAAARDFYVEHFGFRVVFEADWYVQLHASRGESVPPIELAFMIPKVETQPTPLHAAFSGAGIILTLEVDDVDAVHSRHSMAGVLRDVVIPLRDEASGQPHFLIRDPAGVLLDVVQQIPPSAGYAAAYSAQSSSAP